MVIETVSNQHFITTIRFSSSSSLYTKALSMVLKLEILSFVEWVNYILLYAPKN